MFRKEQGITLIALIITIVILLILAGIGIATLTGDNGLFTRAQQAKEKTQESQERENETIENYIAQIDEISDENTLVNKVKSGKIKIGDYVKYEPNSVDINSDEYKTLVSNWGETYSGSTNNSTANLIQDTTLNWRVLDIKDGKVRLISDSPTSNTVGLGGYQGYNNAVYLLDSACRILYNSTLTSKVQNLKIEDIQEKIVEKNYKNITSNYGEKFTPSNTKYPILIEQEKNQNENNVNGKYGVSEQKVLIEQKQEMAASSLELENNTYIIDNVNGESFKNSKYYNIFMNNGKNYSIYWLSSRSIHGDSTNAHFDVRYVNSGSIGTYRVYSSDGEAAPNLFAFRPVITLNSNVKIDTEETRDGNSAETAYVLK